jgi:hypothetical protein
MRRTRVALGFHPSMMSRLKSASLVGGDAYTAVEPAQPVACVSLEAGLARTLLIKLSDLFGQPLDTSARG